MTNTQKNKQVEIAQLQTAKGLFSAMHSGLSLLMTSAVCAVVTVLLFTPIIVCAQQVSGARSLAIEPQIGVEINNGSLKLDYSIKSFLLHIVLPPLDKTSHQTTAEWKNNRPLQIGLHRTLPKQYKDNLLKQINWVSLNDGSIAGAITVMSTNASAIRIGIHAELVAGSEIRFFDGDKTLGNAEIAHRRQDHPTITSKDFYLEGGKLNTLWSPTVEGDTIGIEITLPSQEALSSISFDIVKVAHIFDPIGSIHSPPIDRARCGSVDVQCRIKKFPRYTENSVAKIVYAKDDSPRTCSGTLMNDSVDDTFIPYFLTANHCVSTEEEARSVEAFWFYQRTTCDDRQIDKRYERTTGGAKLLATSVAQDSTLLRFRKRLPVELTYSGWTTGSPRKHEKVYGIHHPKGDAKKYTRGHVVNHKNATICSNSRTNEDCFIVENAIGVDWDKADGTSEKGSSGSGLFHGEYLTGVLSGGPDMCKERIDHYGPFKDFYPMVQRWLNPRYTYRFPHSDVPLVIAKSNPHFQSLVRIINRSDYDGKVYIHAIDDSGRQHGPITLLLDSRTAVNFSSSDLEQGNSSKRLYGGVGHGSGNWRLALTTNVDIEPFAYIHTTDGLLNSIQEVVAQKKGRSIGPKIYEVPIFILGNNLDQQSFLRIVNPSDQAIKLKVYGRDDFGSKSSNVYITLKAGEACTVSAEELESGQASSHIFSHCRGGFKGRLGDGVGKWQLFVSSYYSIEVMSLLLSSTGHLTNLSR